MSSYFERLLLTHRLLPRQMVRLEAELFLMLDEIAAVQGRSVEDLVLEALQELVHDWQIQTRIGSQWSSLTPREQQVAALTCLGFTNQEIANYLTISVNTVRTHIRGALEKYQVGSKTELRYLLADKWDFAGWLEAQQRRNGLYNATSSPETSPMD